jgi:predicted dehydrogenase
MAAFRVTTSCLARIGKWLSSRVFPVKTVKNLFEAKIRDFVDAIKTNGPAPVPGEEIIYNQAICDGIYRSSKLKKEVEITIPAI